MKGKIFLIYIIILCLNLFFLINSCDKDDIPSSVVKGYVYYSGTTIPVSGVTVSIGRFQNTTSSDGYFSINSETGNQIIQANKEGFDQYSYNVNISESINDLNIELTSVKYSCLLYGTVKSDKDELLEGITVVLLNPDGKDSNLKTTTDANGYYQIPAVPQGTRTIRFLSSSNSFETQNSSLFISSNDYPYSVKLNSLIDYLTYQNKRYKIQKIGNQWWMAENMAYLPKLTAPNNWSEFFLVPGYEGNDINEAMLSLNYKTYGALYDWHSAQKVCPPGWHLPSKMEWEQLIKYIIDQKGTDMDLVGKYLKSKTGWYDNGHGSNGTDDFGFSALPGGFAIAHKSSYVGSMGYFWTSTTSNSDTKAWLVKIEGGFSVYFTDFYGVNNYSCSVRFVKN